MSTSHPCGEGTAGRAHAEVVIRGMRLGSKLLSGSLPCALLFDGEAFPGPFAPAALGEQRLAGFIVVLSTVCALPFCPQFSKVWS